MEERPVTPPPFDQVRQRLEQIVQAKKFRQYTDELMHNAKIERSLEPPAAAAAPSVPAAPGAAGAPAPASPPAAPATQAAPGAASAPSTPPTPAKN
jgi:peptidyl-prolyl cis-trans isomerase C